VGARRPVSNQSFELIFTNGSFQVLLYTRSVKWYPCPARFWSPRTWDGRPRNDSTCTSNFEVLRKYEVSYRGRLSRFSLLHTHYCQFQAAFDQGFRGRGVGNSGIGDHYYCVVAADIVLRPAQFFETFSANCCIVCNLVFWLALTTSLQDYGETGLR